MEPRVTKLLKSRASPDMLPFRLCNKKRLAIRHMNGPLFQKTLSIPTSDMGSTSDWGFITNTSFVLYMCVCVCLCSRALMHCVVLESNPRANKNFCTRPAQTTSSSDGKEYLYQVTDGRAWLQSTTLT